MKRGAGKGYRLLLNCLGIVLIYWGLLFVIGSSSVFYFSLFGFNFFEGTFVFLFLLFRFLAVLVVPMMLVRWGWDKFIKI